MLALPPQALYSDGRQKTILRRSLRDVLPPAVRDRTDKASFAPLAEYGLRGPYRPFVVSLLESSEIAALGMVEPRAWRRSVELFLDGGVPLNWPTWRSLAAEMWLRHLGGRLPTPLPRSRVDLAP
jgi:hypothetical protein